MPRTGRLRRIATWFALAGSLGLGLAFVAVRATAPSDGARVEFYGDGWSATGVRIAPIDAPAAGLAAGDTVTSVAGRPIESWLGQALAVPIATIDRPSPDRPIAYGLVDGLTTRTVEVRWEVPALGATLLDGWSVALFSLAFAGVAAFVFARRPDEPAATALMIAACGAAGSSVPWLLGVTVSDIVNGGPFLLHALVSGPIYMVLWPAGVHLALVFPTPTPILRGRRWLIPALYVGTVTVYGLALAAARIASPTNLEWIATWPLIQVAIVVPLLSAALVVFAWSARQVLDPALRTRIRWAMLGGGASATLGLVGFMVPELILRRPLLPAAWIGLAGLPLPLGLAAGMLRDHLFDIDVVVRRTVVYGGLTIGVVACYLTVASGIGMVLGGQTGYGTSLFATGVAALVALPLRDVLQRTVSRLLYGERDEPWRAIGRLGQRLELATHPDLAFPAIVDTVADALRLPYVGLAVIDESGRSILVAEHGLRSSGPVTLSLGHGTELVGSLDLGVRAGERGFRSDEWRLLHDLARQAGAAIHALRLRDDLARSRERLVLAREEERRRLRRDLHDGLGPSLAGIGLRAEAAAATMTSDQDGARRLLEELGAEVQTTLAEVRRLVDGLRPPALDELGLVGAISAQAARLEGGGGTRSSTTISVVASPLPLPDLPAAVEVAAYRIVAEALTNAARHADARSCQVRLEVAEALTIEVVDDGRGLPPRLVRGTGLDSMRGRAMELGGTVRIERRRGGGTRLRVRLPIGGRPVAAPLPPDAATEPMPS